MTMEEAIKILGLEDKEINPQQIRRAFIRLSKKYHPDATGIKDDTMFKRINEAYSVLRSNPVYRKELKSLSEEEIKLMLDSLVLEIIAKFDVEIYRKIVIPELRNWFGGDEPFVSLQENIERKINIIKPVLTQTVKNMFNKFSTDIGAKLSGSLIQVSRSFDAKFLSKLVSDSITDIIGIVATVVIAMISGGSGMALIATGPLGLIIGAGLGFYLFIGNKKDIKERVENYIMYNGLPKIAKDFVADKVIKKVIAGEEKFKKDLALKLKEDLAPIYKQIKLINY